MAKGENADNALTTALKNKGLAVSYNKFGYPKFDNGAWGTFNNTWNTCSPMTATESISYPQHDSFGGFIWSSGWDSFSGYGNYEKKLQLSKSKVFYFAKYDALYGIDDPTKCQLWATANNSPFQKHIDYTADKEYHFYINYGDNNAKTGWYAAKAKNADEALIKATRDKGISFDYDMYGYPYFDSGVWTIYNYTWEMRNPEAATESIVYPMYDSYGGFVKSNGWESFSGYGVDAKKLYQSMFEVFYFNKYDDKIVIDDPTEYRLWTTADNSPFKA